MPPCFCRAVRCDICHSCVNCACTCGTALRLRPPVPPDALPHPKRRRDAPALPTLPGPPFIVPSPQPRFATQPLRPAATAEPVSAPTIPPPPTVPPPPSVQHPPHVLQPQTTIQHCVTQRASPPPLRQPSVSVPQLASALPCVQENVQRAAIPGAVREQLSIYDTQKDALEKVLVALGADTSVTSALQSVQTNEPFDPVRNRSAIRVMGLILRAAAKLINPADPVGLADYFAAREGAPGTAAIHERLVNSVITAMKATKRGTVARRYVRSVLCGSMSRSEVNQLLGYPAGSPDDDSVVNPSGPSRSSAGPVDDPDDDDDECDSQFADGDRLPRMSSKTFSRSRRDWDTLLGRGELQAAKFGRSRVQDEALRNLLVFLFASENISLTSWTRRKLVVSGQRLDMPAVVVSKKSSLMHEEYCRLVNSRGMKPLSRGSFYAVTKALTRREAKRMIPVDNITESLVKDPLVLIRDFIMRSTPYAHRAKLLKQVDNVEWFLVHSYPANHVGKDSSASHDLKFALRSDAFQNSPTSMFPRTIECKSFSCPFTLLDDLYKCGELDETSVDAATLARCRDRFLCYLGLLCCKTAQDRAVERTLTEISSQRLNSRIVIFMNHRLSSEAPRMSKSHLVPGIQNISMHGSIVFFLGAEDGAETQSNELDSSCYNHVVCNDPGDDMSVIAVVAEALFARIREDISHAREVVFVTDNSPRYKNDVVPSLLPHLAKVSGFRALRYIYSCSQLCEFLVDAHFEVVMRFVQERLDCGETLTPEIVVEAINQQDKLPNITGELISLDAQHREFSARLQSDRVSFPWIGDRNEVEYREWIDSANEDRRDLSGSSVAAKAYDYCGIGKGHTLDIKGLWMAGLGSRDDNNAGHDMGTNEAVWVGPVTGVKVIKCARKLNPLRAAKVNTDDATTEGVVMDAITLLHSIVHEDSTKNRAAPTDSEGIAQDDVITGGPVCPSCKRVFKSPSFLKTHTCKGTPLEKDVSARAVVVATELFRENKLPFFRDEAQQLFFSMRDPQVQSRYTPSELWYGWARQPFGFRRSSVPSDLLETGITLTYRKEVFAFLKKDPMWEKLSPSDMLRSLRIPHPGRDDLPSERRLQYWHQLYAARQRIQPYYVSGPDGIPVMSYKEPVQVSSGGKSRMSPLYISKITEMHNQHLNLPEFGRPKPRVMYREFVKFFEDEQGHLPPDFPEQKQVMNKINALRTRSRAERHQQ